MTRRGRPPREDGKRSEKVRINATKEELAHIVDNLTPDERCKALLDAIAEIELLAEMTWTPIHETV